MSFDPTITIQGATGTEARVQDLISDRFASRLAAKDATLWGEAAAEEAAVRLGWLDVFEAADQLVKEATQLREDFASRGVTRVVLAGMGGSSLAPEVMTRTLDVPLTVLDSTHPDYVTRALGQDPASTVLVVSSKSGSTLETVSARDAFVAALAQRELPLNEHMVVVTDPGSGLEAWATERNVSVVQADPNVGGRFSALTAFGIVPTVLAGADLTPVIEDAKRALPLLLKDVPENPALTLAVALAEGSPARFAWYLSDPNRSLPSLGDWIEQLVAESTGKDGKGVLPIAIPNDAPECSAKLPAQAGHIVLHEATTNEAATATVDAGSASLAVSAPLGAQFVLWQVTTAALGKLLGVDPFNQPDVESAKVAARALMAEGNSTSAERPNPGENALAAFASQIDADGYLAIQAFVDPGSELAHRLQKLRGILYGQFQVPVSLGFGPRFLHSTGQFHKGGIPSGAFLQILDTPAVDVEVPDSPLTFAQVISAQAAGDATVLKEHGRPVLVMTAEALTESGM